MFDLPLPFGPTIAVMPGVNAIVVLSAKVLNPLRRTSRSRRRLTEPPRSLRRADQLPPLPPPPLQRADWGHSPRNLSPSMRTAHS